MLFFDIMERNKYFLMQKLEELIQRGEELLRQKRPDFEEVSRITDEIQTLLSQNFAESCFSQTELKLHQKTTQLLQTKGLDEKLIQEIRKIQKKIMLEIQAVEGEKTLEYKILPSEKSNRRNIPKTELVKQEKPEITLKLLWARQKLEEENVNYEIYTGIRVERRMYQYYALVPQNKRLNTALVSLGYGEASYFIPQVEWKELAGKFKSNLRYVKLSQGRLFLDYIDNQAIWQEEFWKKMQIVIDSDLKNKNLNLPETKDFLSFEEARIFLTNCKDFQTETSLTERYQKIREKHLVLPYNPEREYKGDFNSYQHLFGGEKKEEIKRLSFVEARSFLANCKDFQTETSLERRYQKIRSNNHPELPYSPIRTYAEEFNSYQHFFGGKERLKQEKLYTFLEARAFLSYSEELKEEKNLLLRYRKIRKNGQMKLPFDPDKVYKGEFKGYPHLFGIIEKEKPKLLTFEAARAFLIQCTDFADEINLVKRYQKIRANGHLELPASPNYFYKGEFNSFQHLFGGEKSQKKKK